LVSLYGIDAKTLAMSVLAMIDWMTGYPDRAFDRARAALEHARAVGHANSLGLAIGIGIITVYAMARDFAATEQTTAELSALTEKFELADYPILVGFHRGRGRLEMGDNSGLAAMLESFREDSQSDWHWSWEFHAALLAEALGQVGRSVEGYLWLDRAESYSLDGGGHAFEPEIWRTRGDLLVVDGRYSEAEESYNKSIEIARGQGAKSFELRSACRLAGLWRERGKIAEAGDLLAPIYSWFTEGFDTADLKEAKALLDELS
jgi:predicted ATPase